MKGREKDDTYLDFCKAFVTVPHNILLSKLEREGFDGWAVQRTRLHGSIQRVVVNRSVSGWKSVINGAPQKSMLGLVLFTIFIYDTDKRIKHPQEVCR